MKIKLLTIFTILLLSISIHASTISRTQIIMGTYITIMLDSKDKEHIKGGFAIFRGVDNSLSTYNKKATIYRLNRDKKVKQDSYSYEAMLEAESFYKKTDGYFDITIGSLTKDAYSFGDAQKIPSKYEVNSSKVSFQGLSYSKNIAKLEDGIKLDFGGMGKGFAVDKASEYLLSQGVKSATISASGDIRCLDMCTIDVKDPFSNKPLLTFKTTKPNLGITTSGNYNRYVKEVKHNHLINPKTKKPQTKFISITLVGELSSTSLDAYATAISVMPIKKAYKFLNSIGVAYIVLQSDRKLVLSDDFADYGNMFTNPNHKTQIINPSKSINDSNFI